MHQKQIVTLCPRADKATSFILSIGLVLVIGLLFAGCANQSQHCPGQGCTDTSALQTGAEWVVEDIGNRGVLDYARTTITFAADGRVSGNTSCNRYFGQYQSNGATLSIENIGVTKRACVPAVMDQERRFLSLFNAVRSYRIDHTGALLLATANHKTMTARLATPRSSEARATDARTTYACADGSIIQAHYPTEDSARIVYQGETIDMIAALSASGARYVGDGWQWWSKGAQEGTLSPLSDGESIATVRGTLCQRQ